MKPPSLAAQQFGATAKSYLESPVHARGADLDRLRDLAEKARPASVLDLGCGAGHASFAIAPSAAKIIAYDVSAPMVAIVAEEAARRGLTSLSAQEGAVEELPFEDRRFDWVVTRLSAHHWSDVRKALREARRVLKDTGTLTIIDVIAPEEPLFDTILQSVEILRDVSHVRNYRVSEWQTLLTTAGFRITEREVWKIPIMFQSWITRMNTPESRAVAVRSIFTEAPTEARDYFAVQDDYSFEIDAAWMSARPDS